MLIVNQIMIPQLHYCIVIIVTQSLHSPHSSVIELEALVSEYPSVKLSISRNTVGSVCLTFFFSLPSSPRAFSGRHGTYEIRFSPEMLAYMVRGIMNRIFFIFFPAERDAFDTLFDHAPDKLNVVKKVIRPCSTVELISQKVLFTIFLYIFTSVVSPGLILKKLINSCLKCK